MHNSFLALVFTCLATSLFSQIQISGVINDYAKVNDIEPCQAKLTLNDSSPFAVGDQVLLIQMNGAIINDSNASSFGSITDIGSAGFYELNEVLSVTGNTVFLKNELVHSYQTSAALQLVTVPQYTNVEVSGELFAKPWDGQTGGVLALAADQLNLQANINLSGAGFRGGQKLEVVSDCNFLTNADAYFYPVNNWRGSPKGEGIADLIQGKEHGRGAQANGGGGGNDHNSGGGGGGNISNGGVGGKESVGGFGCDGDYPGVGGKAGPNENGRIFLGGGGGAGHFDDTSAGSSGGNGGGIALILSENIQANGFSILANGNAALLAHGDGAGGGGAGGTVVIQANSIAGNLSVVANGGDGGSINNATDRCDGPGGGGSGGRLLSNSINFTQVDLSGGQPGINNTVSSQCNGQSNGAAPGELGEQSSTLSIPIGQTPIIPIVILQQPIDLSVCENEPATFSFQLNGNSLTFQWQMNSGNGWLDLLNSPNYLGVSTNELSILSATAVLNGTQFRCLVTGFCGADFYSNEVLLEVTAAPSAGFSSTSQGIGSFQFQNTSTNATSYIWDFGDGTVSSETDPLHNFAGFGNFTVTLTATGPCGEGEFSLVLLVEDPNAQPVAQFSSNFTGGCSPLTVHFQNLSTGINLTGFEWQFPGGNPNSSINENPIVMYDTPGFYQVQLAVTGQSGSDIISIDNYIEVKPAPVSNFSFSQIGQVVYFTNQSAGANSYHWDFGDGTISQEANPVHEFPGFGVFNVVLTANNQSCANSIAQEVYFAASAANEEGQDSGATILPNPAKEVVTIFLPKENWRGLVRYKVVDAIGRQRISGERLEERFEILLTGLSQGMYFLEISDGEKSMVWKLVKL